MLPEGKRFKVVFGLRAAPCPAGPKFYCVGPLRLPPRGKNIKNHVKIAVLSVILEVIYKRKVDGLIRIIGTLHSASFIL